MANLTKKEKLNIVKEHIAKLKDKNFNVYFFVLDTKGNPSSALEYIYQTAYTLNEEGYNVTMLHQEKEFVGVGDWLGEKYASLKHANIEKENVETSPCDFLFIPEIFANVMMQTKNLSCKRVVIVQNTDHTTEFMPVSQTMGSLLIRDAIVTTKEQEDKLGDYFPELVTHIVPPSIKPIFRNSNEHRDLLVNIITKEQSHVNRMIKPFYWKNPIYQWVSFRDLRGVPQDMFADALRSGAVTIWADDDTAFGYTLLEALRCGSIVLAKIPDNPASWMLDENGNLTDKILWFSDYSDISNILPNVIRSWTMDKVPEVIYEGQKAFDTMYTEDEQKKAIIKEYADGLFAQRLKEFEEIKINLENGTIK